MAGSFINTTPDPGNPTDNSIGSILNGGSAGGQVTAPNDVTAGTTAAGSGLRDSNGNEVIVVGTVKVSLDQRVASSQTVQRAGTTTTQAYPIESGGALSVHGANPTTRQPGVTVPKLSTVEKTIQEAGSWTTTQKNQFVLQAQQSGLISNKHPSLAEIIQAWALVVQEAQLQNVLPEDLMKKAAGSGWSGISPTLQPADVGLSGGGDKTAVGGTSGPTSTTDTTTGTTTSTNTTGSTTSHTSYISYMDPATAQGTLADAFYRLLGRTPTTTEYQAFLNSLYSYEDQANTGKFETGVVLKEGQKIDEKTGQVVDVKTGAPIPEKDITRIDSNTVSGSTNTDINKSIVSQRGISTRGAQFLAGQTAMNNPEYGAYQAATTYFHALVQALQAPAAGMQQSGPTVTAP